MLGFLVELGWAFVGSLGLELGASSAAGPLQAHLWLGGVFIIAAGTAAAALLASPERRDSD